MDLMQYNIVLVNLDPTIGSEIKKTRPCVIISPDEMNKYLQTIVVAPMTNSSKSYPTRVQIKHVHKETGKI
jgi:mRNA interferase MazF